MQKKRWKIFISALVLAALLGAAAAAETQIGSLIIFDDEPAATEPPQPSAGVTLAPVLTPQPVPSATSAPQPTVTPAPNPVVYTQGDENEGVREMKERLQSLGYFSRGNTLSAEYSSATAERVAQFQAMNGLRQTGEADAMTLSLLFAESAVSADATARPALSALYAQGELPADAAKDEAAVREALSVFFPLSDMGG